MPKICTICGIDVSGRKRTKDSAGHYFCETCYAARLQQIKSAPAAKAQPAPAPAEEDDGLYSLSGAPSKPASAQRAVDITKLDDEAPAAEIAVTLPTGPVAPCAECGLIVPERILRELDGVRLCIKCHQAALREKERVKENTIPGLAGMGITGIVISAVATLVITWGLMSGGVLLGIAGKGVTDTIVAILAGAFLTAFCVLQAGLLVASMTFTSRLLGGIDFGPVAHVIWKTMVLGGLGVLANLAQHIMSDSSMAMMAWTFAPTVSFVGLLLLFKLDYFEAVILSAVNSVIGFITVIGLLIMLANVLHIGTPPKAHDSDFEPTTTMPTTFPDHIEWNPVGPE